MLIINYNSDDYDISTNHKLYSGWKICWWPYYFPYNFRKILIQDRSVKNKGHFKFLKNKIDTLQNIEAYHSINGMYLNRHSSRLLTRLNIIL